MLINSLGRGVGEALDIARSWLPLLVALALFEISRGFGNELGRSIAVTPQIDVERFLLGSTLPEIAQGLLRRDEPTWVDAFLDLVYTSFYFAPLVAAAYLWTRHRELWKQYSVALVTVSFIAVAVFLAVPTAPPWFAADEGLIEVSRLSGRGLNKIGMSIASTVVYKGRHLANPVAAIPSIHMAYTCLVAWAFWKGGSGGWYRWLWWSYPPVMLLSMGYLGEHYLIDGLVSVPLVAFALALGRRWVDARTSGAVSPPPGVGDT
jgi:hypothetical protein